MHMLKLHLIQQGTWTPAGLILITVSVWRDLQPNLRTQNNSCKGRAAHTGERMQCELCIQPWPSLPRRWSVPMGDARRKWPSFQILLCFTPAFPFGSSLPAWFLNFSTNEPHLFVHLVHILPVHCLTYVFNMKEILPVIILWNTMYYLQKKSLAIYSGIYEV